MENLFKRIMPNNGESKEENTNRYLQNTDSYNTASTAAASTAPNFSWLFQAQYGS